MVMAMGAVTLLAPGLDMPISVQAAEAEMQVEVTMKDMAYVVKGLSMPGALTAIVVRNQDSVTHGFSSPVSRKPWFARKVGEWNSGAPRAKDSSGRTTWIQGRL